MTDSITPALSAAFDQAVRAYAAWLDIDGPEPQFPVDRHSYGVSAVCNLVMPFADHMPKALYETLMQLAGRKSGGQFVPESTTYASGAKSLAALVAYELDQRRRKEQEMSWRK